MQKIILRYDRETLKNDQRTAAILHFNKAIPDRFRQVFSPSQIGFANFILGGTLAQMGYQE